MTFRIDVHAAPADEIRRIVSEQLARARGELAGGRADVHSAIHDVRKRGKKLRALMRLVRDAAPETYDRTNAQLRDGARLLSAMRDAQAVVETCDALDEHAVGVEAAALAHARRELVAQRDADVSHSEAHMRLADFGRVLEKVDRAASDWPLARLRLSHFVDGATRTYRRGRNALDDSGGPTDTEGLHEVRKRAKYGRFHHRLLQELAPRRMKAARKDLDEIGSLLGDHHDLAALDERLPSISLPGSDRRALERLLERRRRALYGRAYDFARRTYAETPSAFTARLEAYVTVADDSQAGPLAA